MKRTKTVPRPLPPGRRTRRGGDDPARPRNGHAQAVDGNKWGAVTSPVFGKFQTGTYNGAEPFAGPNQGANYFSGVLPNGKIVAPAGNVAQVGMNPLGVAVTPDGKYIITTNDDERNNGNSPHSNLVGGYTISVVSAATMQVVST